MLTRQQREVNEMVLGCSAKPVDKAVLALCLAQTDGADFITKLKRSFYRIQNLGYLVEFNDFESFMSICVILQSGDHAVSTGIYVATGSSTIKVCGNAIVFGFDVAEVIATKDSLVFSFDKASSVLFDTSRLISFDYSKFIAYENATVAAYDHCRGSATGYSKVCAYDNVILDAYDRSSIVCKNDVRVRAYKACKLKAYDNCVAYLFDDALGWFFDNSVANASGNSLVCSHGNKSANSRSNHQIFRLNYPTVNWEY